MNFTEDLKLNFPSMIAENFRVVLTKYIRIATDVFINRAFKGNTVTDRDSALIGHPQARSSQCVASLSVPGLPLSQNIASYFHSFRHAGSHTVSFVGEGEMPLSHHGPPVNSSEYPKYLSSIVSKH